MPSNPILFAGCHWKAVLKVPLCSEGRWRSFCCIKVPFWIKSDITMKVRRPPRFVSISGAPSGAACRTFLMSASKRGLSFSDTYSVTPQWAVWKSGSRCVLAGFGFLMFDVWVWCVVSARGLSFSDEYTIMQHQVNKLAWFVLVTMEITPLPPPSKN